MTRHMTRCIGSLIALSNLSRRGTGKVHVTPITQGSDFRLVLAPSVSFEKSSTIGGTFLSQNVPVCGWSLEFNVVSDVDVFLSKTQVWFTLRHCCHFIIFVLCCLENSWQIEKRLCVLALGTTSRIIGRGKCSSAVEVC